MNQKQCETVRQAAMALADGESAPLSAEQVQSHLAGCPACRCAMEELGCLNRTLGAQSRQRKTVDVWPAVQGGIAVRTAASRSSNPAGMLITLAAALLLVRGIVLTTTEPLEWVARFVALLLVSGWFFLIRENPFAIHPQLAVTKESKP